MAKAPTSLNVSLTPELTEFILVRVASGRYQSASEVVRAGLRLLERDEAAFAAMSVTPRGRDTRDAGDARD
ncbi:MAG: type II toxin-antitoxin system ParD family antitoxin [Methylorubrum extorquens]|uniref:type II toxin-antitoxin system ParD family antitoxin n=1 Tax=Methylorubrum extorquens TaxID=408 RepID=UPI002FEE2D12